MATQKKKTPAKKQAPKPKIVMYASKKVGMYHPYQNVRFDLGVPTACQMDSWLSSQINAGLIAEV